MHKKILYVFCSQNYSGAEIVVKRLISANINEAAALALCPPGEFAQSLKEAAIPVIEENALLSLQRRNKQESKWKILFILLVKFLKINATLLRACIKHNLSFIHTNNLAASIYSLPSLFLCKLFKRNIRWLWSNHDLNYPSHQSDRLLAKVCHRYYHCTLAVSQAVAKTYPNYQEKIQVLYNGINTEEFCFNSDARQDFRSKYDFSEQETLIGIVGQISEGKGQHLLIEAFQELIPSFPQARLLLIGNFSPEENDYKTKILNQISSLPAYNYIFLGKQSNMPWVYSGLDIVINATTSQRSEPLGTTIYEAMACERIVIASDTGGTPEIIEDEKDGFLFAADSVIELKSKLLNALIKNKDLNLIRKNAREKVLEKFNITKITDHYNAILRKLQ